jgi:DNA-binding HxlR family transcriptional regulator
MKPRTIENIFTKKGVFDILTTIYLKGSATCYQIAKDNLIPYKIVWRRVKELEAAGIIYQQEIKIIRGKVNIRYSFTSQGKETFREFQRRRIKMILEKALILGFDPYQLLQEVEKERKQKLGIS